MLFILAAIEKSLWMTADISWQNCVNSDMLITNSGDIFRRLSVDCIYISLLFGFIFWSLVEELIVSDVFEGVTVWPVSIESNVEYRLGVEKNVVLVLKQSCALVVFFGDLNSLLAFGDGEFESSLFEKSLLMTRGGTLFLLRLFGLSEIFEFELILFVLVVI
jgi:hypothetical protein